MLLTQQGQMVEVTLPSGKKVKMTKANAAKYRQNQARNRGGAPTGVPGVVGACGAIGEEPPLPWFSMNL